VTIRSRRRRTNALRGRRKTEEAWTSSAEVGRKNGEQHGKKGAKLGAQGEQSEDQ
jgi:hypothetical protein